MVLGRMRMAGKTHARAAPQKPEQLGTIRRVHRGLIGIQIGAQRDVHRDNDQPVGWGFLQHIGDEGELSFADAADIFAVLARLTSVGSQVIDIVEHQK
jgi:hypothetical protein